MKDKSLQKTERITIAFTEDQYNKVKERAEKENRPISSYIRIKIMQIIENEES